jgi:hypothetical protein
MVETVMPIAAQGAETSMVALDRPFVFFVVLWGERFRNYFLEFCVPSLLSPGNFPALNTTPRSKILIATRPEDWTAIASTTIFRLLERYVDPVFIEIPPCPPGQSGYQHMGTGHRLACEMAYRDKAYAVLLTPDCMLSDGSVARLQELARAGTELVLTAALRFGEETFLGNLKTMGILPEESRGGTGSPLVITGQQMAHAAINGLHSETLAYEWDAPGFLLVIPAAWWKVPAEDGIVLHCLSWAPMLLDYGAIGAHDTSTFDQWTFDGDYLYNNSKNLKQVHVVQDSDELFLASWGPLAEHAITKRRIPFIGNLVAKAQFGANFKSAFFDPFKRRLFFLPVRWHGQPLNAKWRSIEDHAMRDLRRYVTPPEEALFDGAHDWREKTRRLAGHAFGILFAILRPVFTVLSRPKAIWQKLRQAASGDRAAIRQLFWYVRLFGLNK